MMKYLIIGAAAFALLGACAEKPAAANAVIAAHVAGFNAQDMAAMAAQEHPDIEWFSVNGADMSLEVAGRDALGEVMKDMFESPTKVRGTLRDWSVNGNYIAVTETAQWAGKDGAPQAQSALTVYEMEDGLIRRVYYYPAAKP